MNGFLDEALKDLMILKPGESLEQNNSVAPAATNT
jgi:hypothetical protein